MSFSFSFDLDSSEVDQEVVDSLPPPTEHLGRLALDDTDEATDGSRARPVVPHKQVTLKELFDTLPPLLSYTPVSIPLSPSPPPAGSPSSSGGDATTTTTLQTSASSSRTATLLRRDLFDARFQILNQDEEDPSTAATASGRSRSEQGDGEGTTASGEKGGLAQRREGAGVHDRDAETTYIDEATDLVKGVYEGGLKTWECSLDLVDCLDRKGFQMEATDEQVRGKSVLEVGCGTAIPTCALFAKLLNEIRASPTEHGERSTRKTTFHLQDYNKQVLSLITLPNLLLTYARHLATHSTATPTPVGNGSVEEISADAEPEHPPVGQDPGELELTPEFLESFDALLERESIEFEFSEGDWSGMDDAVRGRGGYDVVLTSETVYEVSSLDSLIKLLRAAASRDDERTLCLVACKRIYFGVGGGELEFRRRVEETGATVESVWGEGTGKGKSEGVGRTVLEVRWTR
ncbi:hypothetical protein JCM10212_004325 [Sporobolomyces blumeae]